MALGLGFNKSKALQTAEKYVLQGKLTAAISEYAKIIKKDPHDLMILNAMGDLYVRAGKTDEALQCFYELAEKSVEAGFVPRAIAVYKRITKIDPGAIAALLKLGELYGMQGLMRDARTHYLQVVEIHARRQDLPKATEVFEKVLLLDIENPRLQRRMGELYAQTGKSSDAVASYLTASERFLDTNEPAEALATLDTLLQLEPHNQEAQVLRGRVFLQQGDTHNAITALDAVDSLVSSKPALKTLFHAYRQAGDLARAMAVAQSIFETHDDFSELALVADDLCGKGESDKAVELYRSRAGRLQAQGHLPVLIEGLQKIWKADSSNWASLELLWAVYRRTGEIGEGRETAELLAHAYVAAGQLEKAREIYAELTALEPDNLEHQRLLRQVEARIHGVPEGGAPADSTPVLSADGATSAEVESNRVDALSAREQELVRNCLTEAELYRTYRQMQRAVETLENGLLGVPGNVTLYESLLSIQEQIGDYEKAAQCAQALTEAYTKNGDGERAARYGELVAGYQQKARENAAAVEAAQLAAVEEAPEDSPAGGSPSEQSQVLEIDLSTEWAALSESGSAAASVSTPDDIVEEVEFYLQADMIPEASAALQRLRQNFPDHPALSSYAERLGEALPPSTTAEDDGASVPAPERPSQVEPPAALLAPYSAAPVAEEPELALDELFQSGRAPSQGSGFELTLEEPSAPAGVEPARGAAPSQNRASALSAAPQAAPGAGFLDDVFAEFKQEVGEPAATEDPETHYNMGVAFKEMGLYEEAIGEFQKVHQLSQSAKDYSRVVPCCSLLATCFLEKGMPQLAVKWYQTALDSPGLDAESSTALLFEVGSAYEIAGDRPAALKNFLEVYARNIDYRNVAERIRELQQGS